VYFNVTPFKEGGSGRGKFGPFGEIVFPYRKFGPNISSMDLFVDIPVFEFYWKNRDKYKTAVDIGANIGLHSLLLAKCGCHVFAFEPDEDNRAELYRTMDDNNVKFSISGCAVSDRWGDAEFVSVKDNTTGSHIVGSKLNPYGPLDKYRVPTVSIEGIAAWSDLIKMDAEGHEATIIEAINPEQWNRMDMIVEIHSEENAGRIQDYIQQNGLSYFSMNGRFAKAVPASPRDGQLFITLRDRMPNVI
jgi:FkbM family methyltransferase